MPPLQQTGLNRKVRKEREEEIFLLRYAKDPLRCLSGSSVRSTGRSLSLGVPFYRKCHPEGGAGGVELRDQWGMGSRASLALPQIPPLGPLRPSVGMTIDTVIPREVPKAPS